MSTTVPETEAWTGADAYAARFADQLANLDMVALFDQRLGGCADVLLQRDDNPRRGRKLCDGVMTIDSLAVFALVGVNTPGKQT